MELRGMKGRRNAFATPHERLNLMQPITVEQDDIPGVERNEHVTHGARCRFVCLVCARVNQRPHAEPTAANRRMDHRDQRKSPSSMGKVPVRKPLRVEVEDASFLRDGPSRREHVNTRSTPVRSRNDATPHSFGQNAAERRLQARRVFLDPCIRIGRVREVGLRSTRLEVRIKGSTKTKLLSVEVLGPLAPRR